LCAHGACCVDCTTNAFVRVGSSHKVHSWHIVHTSHHMELLAQVAELFTCCASRACSTHCTYRNMPTFGYVLQLSQALQRFTRSHLVYILHALRTSHALHPLRLARMLRIAHLVHACLHAPRSGRAVAWPPNISCWAWSTTANTSLLSMLALTSMPPLGGSIPCWHIVHI